MKRSKLLFIVNPKSGKGQIKNHLLDILDYFTKAGYEPTVCITQKKGEATELVARKGLDYDLLVCSGGDGTLNEVVNGLIAGGVNVPIGYIPAGSTNDFAGSLGLPKQMTKAAKTAIKGEPFACDIGLFQDKIFVYVAAFGILTEVSYDTAQELKNVLGHMAYVLKGIQSLTGIKAYPMRITHDGGIIVGKFIYGMITNSNSVGGFKNITGKNVELNDGQLEVTLIRLPGSMQELNQIIASLLEKDGQNEFIFSFKTKHLEIVTEEEIAWTLDGEFGGLHRNVKIEDVQEAFTIMI